MITQVEKLKSCKKFNTRVIGNAKTDFSVGRINLRSCGNCRVGKHLTSSVHLRTLRTEPEGLAFFDDSITELSFSVNIEINMWTGHLLFCKMLIISYTTIYDLMIPCLHRITCRGLFPVSIPKQLTQPCIGLFQEGSSTQGL